MVKKHPPERDPEGFAKVRAAYEQAQDLLDAGFFTTLEPNEGAPPEPNDAEPEEADPATAEPSSPASEGPPESAPSGAPSASSELPEPLSLEAWIAEDEARRRAMQEHVEELVARFEDDPEGVTLEVLELVHEGEAVGHSAAERLVFIAAWRGGAIDPELERVCGVDRTRLVYARQLGRRVSPVWTQLPPTVRQLLSCPPWMVFETRQAIAKQVQRSPEVFLHGLLVVDRAHGDVVDYLATLLGIAPLGAEPNDHGHEGDAGAADGLVRADDASALAPLHRLLTFAWGLMLVCAVPFACMVILQDDWPASWLFPYLFGLVSSSVAVLILKDRHYRRVVRPTLIRLTFEEAIHPGAVVAWAEGDRSRTLATFLPDIKADPFLAISAAVAGVLEPIEDDDDDGWYDDESDGDWEDDDDDGDWEDDDDEDLDDYDLGPRERRERARRRRRRRKP